MYAAYMGIMASMCASPAELAESSSPYRHLARDTQRVKAAGEWVRDAEGDDFEILLQALQIEIRAKRAVESYQASSQSTHHRVIIPMFVQW